MATTYLTRTPGSNGSVTTATMSAWVKRSATGEANQIFGGQTGVDGNNRTKFGIETDDTMACQIYNGGSSYDWKSNRLLTDCSGWYHLVFVFDTSDGVAGDRIRFYCNGERITSFATQDTIPLNAELKMNTTSDSIYVGARKTSSTVNQFFNGCMSYVYFIDGTDYEASTFGSTDSDTGEWTINTSPTVTMGTNGFLILKNGDTITDQSTNSNDLTLGGGTLTATEDCPADVFNTMNPLDNYYSAGTFSNGNTTYVTGTNATPNSSTIGVSKGKFYWEVKYVSKSAGLRYPMIGISSTQATATGEELGHYANDWAFYASDTTPYYRNNNTNTSYGTLYTEGDVVCVALDADNNKLYFRINDGSWENSGDPTSGATGTGAISITAPASTPLGVYFPTIGYYDSNSGTFNANFGNGYFGTTIISSEGTNASGIGKFEYNVPAGYTAISAKGMNS